jgi:hypothetical protein
MMAVMVLGMPPVYSCHTSTGSEALGGGGRMEPRIYPPILTRESKETRQQESRPGQQPYARSHPRSKTNQ